MDGDKGSFISLYSPTILYVYIFKKPSLIKELRKLGFEEVEAYHESVFHIPINKFDVIKEILPIVRIRSCSETDKQKLNKV
ncbi:MAG: hypothetical protein QW783_02885 [Candidatus Micrarchaeia archaeon]